MKSLCVFCGSSIGAKPIYAEEAIKLGILLAKNNIELIYGGGSIGLMGKLADVVLESGGKVTGVIPQFLYDKEVGHDGLTKLHIVETMHERKMLMASLSEGFLAMPGGIGTLEELFEIFTWNQLGLVKYPVAIINIGGYFNELLSFLEKMENEGFIKEIAHKKLLKLSTSEEVIKEMSDWIPKIVGSDLSKT